MEAASLQTAGLFFFLCCVCACVQMSVQVHMFLHVLWAHVQVSASACVFMFPRMVLELNLK